MLSLVQIREHYWAGTGGRPAIPNPYATEVLADAPDFYYRLGEPSGTTMNDTSGNARHGTYSGTATLGAAGALAEDGDTALTLGGAGYGQGPTSPSTTAAQTAEVWFRTTSTGAGTLISKYGDTNAEKVFGVDLQAADGVRCYGRTASALRVVTSTVSGLRDGAWHHAAATYDGAAWRLYIDGMQVGSLAIAGTLNPSTTGWRVGSKVETPDVLFVGDLDEAAVYPTALSATRIRRTSWPVTTAPTER